MTVLARWLARLRQRQAPVPVRILGRAALGHAHAVFVIDVDGRRFLVGTAPGCIARLGSWDTGSGDTEGAGEGR
jgi:flagellar biogenesis protein FliO